MSTLTPNYNLILPAVNSPTDEDIWGDELNANLSSLDTIIKAISDIANAATTAIAALGTAANFDVGTGANNIVQLNGSAQYPAADGSLITGLFNVAAKVNLSAVDASGTYVRSGNTVTVTQASHGMSTGHGAYLDFTSGSATDAYYIVTVVNGTTYTVTDAASGSTSGNVTRKIWARNPVNIASVTKGATGVYTINLTTPTTTAFPNILGTGQGVGGNAEAIIGIDVGTTPTSSQIVISCSNSTGALFDSSFISLTIFN